MGIGMAILSQFPWSRSVLAWVTLGAPVPFAHRSKVRLIKPQLLLAVFADPYEPSLEIAARRLVVQDLITGQRVDGVQRRQHPPRWACARGNQIEQRGVDGHRVVHRAYRLFSTLP